YSQDAAIIMGCGEPIDEHEVIVVDPDIRTRTCVGELWVRGPSVANGYWKRPRESAETFNAYLADGNGPYLRTGDLGFLRDGQVFIYSRIKSLIILHGKNVAAEDLEATVQASH